MVKDRRTRDQKRKEKLAQKARNSRKSQSQAYMGNKFKTDELIPLWMETEIGIYEAYVMTDRKLLDQTVVESLDTLIEQMRIGTPPPSDATEVRYEVGREADLVIGNIRRHWAKHFETDFRPSKDQCVGVLRTILGSIEKMRSPGPRSQSYMHHIAGFLTKKLGVKVERFSADMQPVPEPIEEELVRIGRQWTVDADQDAKADFFEVAGDLLRAGRSQRVIDACHLLMGELSDPASEPVADLAELSNQARKVLVTSMG